MKEETLKAEIKDKFFSEFRYLPNIDNIDFVLTTKEQNLFLNEYIHLLWAEAKKEVSDIYASFAQLIITIGKAKTFNRHLPPNFISAFDNEKIAFLPYYEIQDIFYMNDFNWNVAPSNCETKEFKFVCERIKNAHKDKLLLYYFDKDETQLRFFIKNSIEANAKDIRKIKIDKNNFAIIFHRWLDEVKQYIDFDWKKFAPKDILPCDFYRADLFVDDNDSDKIEDTTPITDKLFILFKDCNYCIPQNKVEKILGEMAFGDFVIRFKEGGREKYAQFWKKYKRPPIEEFHKFIIDRRDLLVPQDVREHKGAFFTPKIWVEKSQEYLAKEFGVNWQDEYYIWDCAAGTGNLLVGLQNKYKIWASDYDIANVSTMHERIENGANLLAEHCFKFDFLNDDVSKLPAGLKNIIENPQERKKLIIYINPPYAEAAQSRTMSSTGANKPGVAISHKINKKYKNKIGNASNELFALFLARIYDEFHGCKIGEFSKMKALNGANFRIFREYFKAKLKRGFIVPSFTFDNVNGKFPIGFKIWDTENEAKFTQIALDVYDKNAEHIGIKRFHSYDKKKYLNEWYKKYIPSNKEEEIVVLNTFGNDFYHQNNIHISTDNNFNHTSVITKEILTPTCVYFAVRKAMKLTWINDRDQFLFPNDKWENDVEFHNDCLIYTLFSDSNNIKSELGKNYWIPFFEQEVNAKNNFESNFMANFLKDKILSATAKNTLDCAKELWKYYHSKQKVNVNASFYDIREYFQKRNDKTGKMNNKSEDAQYTELLENLREKMKILAQKIEPKIYEYEFLM
ncbi:MAG: hypothetical protein FWF51_11865 [Chitinivibrionia bacterium]|nr:hypothetical protein [Chitinivibrionia bacterium]